MSEWITDRRPTKEDADKDHCVWSTYDGKVVYLLYDTIKEGTPWMPIFKPEPYVKPKRRTAKPYVAPMDKHHAMFYMGNDREDWSWRVYDGSEYVASKLPTQDAAERIAAIYNEVMS